MFLNIVHLLHTKQTQLVKLVMLAYVPSIYLFFLLEELSLHPVKTKTLQAPVMSLFVG